MQRRINAFRAFAGLPGNVTFDATWNARCQKAALMMSANNSLSHDPPSNWTCFSADGHDAASVSNLGLGNAGPGAVNSLISDPGSGNFFVGHRRYFLYPPAVLMSAGSVTPASHPACAFGVVFDYQFLHPVSPEWVAWPPPGFVPQQLVYPRWSFSYNGADFTNATVSMLKDGSGVSLSQEQQLQGYGDNTLVWNPSGLPTSPPASDQTYDVTISNVMVQGSPRQFTYRVVIIDPSRTVVTPTIAPTATPSVPASSDPSVVLATLNSDQWDMVGLEGVFSVPVFSQASGLGLAANDPTSTFGFWQTRSELQAPPAGRYRVTLNFTDTAAVSGKRHPEIRARVFRADNRVSNMGLVAETGPGVGQISPIEVDWQSDGTTPWRIAVDIMSFSSDQTGGATVTSITNTAVN